MAPQGDRAPILSLSGPRSVLPGTQARVHAEATDNVGVTDVTFAVAGAAAGPLGAPPYNYDLAVPPVAAPGTIIVVRATARDAAGNTSAAELALTITAAPDNENPTILLNAPATAARGTTLRLSASAADNDSVARVIFTVAGVVTTDTAAGSRRRMPFPPTRWPAAPSRSRSRRSMPPGTAPPRLPRSASSTPPTSRRRWSRSRPQHQVLPGGSIPITVTASDDTGIAAVIVSVDGARVATLTAAPYAASYAVPLTAVPGMLFRVEARAIDFAGLEESDVRFAQVAAAAASEALVIGEVYDDATGLPLAGAAVSIVGSSAAPLLSDERGRFALSAASGDLVVRIARAGYTSVVRQVVATTGVRELIDARLTPRPAAVAVAPVLGGELHAGTATLIVPAGALASAESLSFTPVSAQGLAGPLPAGWSPVAVADVAPFGLSFGVPAILRLPMPGGGGSALTLSTWDDDARLWRAVAIGSDGQATLDGPVSRGGQYTWLRPDVVPEAPPPQPAR